MNERFPVDILEPSNALLPYGPRKSYMSPYSSASTMNPPCRWIRFEQGTNTGLY